MIADVLLGAAAGTTDVLRWAARPLARVCTPPEPIRSVLVARGRLARAELESAADLALRWVLVRVVESVDLPEIVRQSSGTLASEAVQGVRAQTMQADDAVAHVVDRVLRRRPAQS